MGRKGIIVDNDDEIIFKKATKSQYSSVLYEQLKKDKRLDRFIAALQACGVRNLSLNDTCKYLTKLFPSYCRGKGLNPKTLATMISFYPDLEEAFGFSADIGAMMVYNRAKALAETTEDMGDIKLFNEMYDSGDMVYIREEKEKEDASNDKGNTSIVFSVNSSGSDRNE